MRDVLLSAYEAIWSLLSSFIRNVFVSYRKQFQHFSLSIQTVTRCIDIFRLSFWKYENPLSAYYLSIIPLAQFVLASISRKWPSRLTIRQRRDAERTNFGSDLYVQSGSREVLTDAQYWSIWFAAASCLLLWLRSLRKSEQSSKMVGELLW